MMQPIGWYKEMLPITYVSTKYKLIGGKYYTYMLYDPNLRLYVEL